VSRLRTILTFASATVIAWLAICAAIGVFAVEGAVHLPHLALTVPQQKRVARMVMEHDAVRGTRRSRRPMERCFTVGVFARTMQMESRSSFSTGRETIVRG
jgi:hypothetical protein